MPEYREITIETLGPDGETDRFSYMVSREVYAMTFAAIDHAGKHSCRSDEVKVRVV